MPEVHVCLSKTVKLTSNSGSGSPFASHSGGAEWWKDHQSGGGPPASNGTKIKERQEHHEYVHLSDRPRFSSSSTIGGRAAYLASSSSTSMMALAVRALAVRAPMKPKLRNVKILTSTFIFQTTREIVKLMSNRKPSSIPSEFFKHKHEGSGSPSSSSSSTSTNETKIKERQGPPPGDKSGPPEGLTYAFHRRCSIIESSLT